MRVFSKIFGIVVTVITVAVMIIAAILVVPRAFGLEPMVVYSASMEPLIKTGSIAYINTYDRDVAIGDVVMYALDTGEGEMNVTHRIVGEVDGYWITQGDANDAPDLSPVAQSQIRGTYSFFEIPFAGYLLINFRQKEIIASIVIIVVLNLMSMLLKYGFEDD